MVGPNGIGKSTILKLISGELQPSSGTVFRSAKVTIIQLLNLCNEKYYGQLFVLRGCNNLSSLEPWTIVQLETTELLFSFTCIHLIVFKFPLQVRIAVFSQHHVDGLDLTSNPLLYMMRCFPVSFFFASLTVFCLLYCHFLSFQVYIILRMYVSTVHNHLSLLP